MLNQLQHSPSPMSLIAAYFEELASKDPAVAAILQGTRELLNLHAPVSKRKANEITGSEEDPKAGNEDKERHTHREDARRKFNATLGRDENEEGEEPNENSQRVREPREKREPLTRLEKGKWAEGERGEGEERERRAVEIARQEGMIEMPQKSSGSEEASTENGTVCVSQGIPVFRRLGGEFVDVLHPHICVA